MHSVGIRAARTGGSAAEGLRKRRPQPTAAETKPPASPSGSQKAEGRGGGPRTLFLSQKPMLELQSRMCQEDPIEALKLLGRTKALKLEVAGYFLLCF